MMSNTPLNQLETAFCELFPDAVSFYRGLKSLMAVGDTSQPADQPTSKPQVTIPKAKFVNRKMIKSRIFDIISNGNVVMTSAEIVEKLQEIDPDTTEDISSYLTSHRKDGILVNHSPTGSRRDTYWGIKHWRKPEGDFKPEYLPENY